MIGTSFDLVWHLGYQRSSTYSLHVSHRMCLLVSDLSSCLTTLSMPGASLSFANPPYIDGAVATNVRAVFGECIVSSLRDINHPVSADLSEVLLLFGRLGLPPRNLSSPIPRPGNAPVDPMWNLGYVLG